MSSSAYNQRLSLESLEHLWYNDASRAWIQGWCSKSEKDVAYCAYFINFSILSLTNLKIGTSSQRGTWSRVRQIAWVTCNFVGPKFRGSQFSWVPNFVGPKFRGSQFSWVPNFVGPKFRGSIFVGHFSWVIFRGSIFVGHFSWVNFRGSIFVGYFS